MSQENETVPEAKAEVVGESAEPSTLVDTIFDIGLAWAEYGVGQGKVALQTSASTLEKVARSLADLQDRLKKKAA